LKKKEELDRRYVDEPKRTSDEALLRRQAEETTKQQEAARTSATETPGKAFQQGGAEITDAQQVKLSRYLGDSEDDRFADRDHPDPDRQHEAPGGGRTRSR
jgi:hypothetical protein